MPGVIALVCVLMNCSSSIQPMLIANHNTENVIVGLYIWHSGEWNKGSNLLEESIQPGDERTFEFPAGVYNILAFDDEGRAYGLPEHVLKSRPDTVNLNAEYITFDRPNFDLGQYLLSLTNGLPGFALKEISITESGTGSTYHFSDLSLFPGQAASIWLPKGHYEIIAVDEIDRIFDTGELNVPGETPFSTLSESMIEDPSLPLGEAGEGDCSLLIENCIPGREIRNVRIDLDNGTPILFLDSLAVQPGSSIVTRLQPGSYYIMVMDSGGDRYGSDFTLDVNEIKSFHASADFLLYDLGFPQGRD